IETIKSLTSEENRYQNIDSEFVDYLEKSFKLSKYSILQTSLKQGNKISSEYPYPMVWRSISHVE
ncbi:bacteriocin ABC transporter, partial [Streptococcus pneumoniae]|nr:bacteriocin ABC transporter [Streptococcus pneumoniae]